RLPEIKSINQDSIMPYLYLFFIDLCSVDILGLYSDYEDREPGYGAALIKAINYSFQQSLDHKLTPSFIKAVHQRAVGHLKVSSEYKTVSNNFTLDNGLFRSQTVTKAGLWQFISTWLIDID